MPRRRTRGAGVTGCSVLGASESALCRSAAGRLATARRAIGSVTKIFTATVLAGMVSRGEVALEDSVAQYLPPQVRLPSRNGKRIRLLDLATHTSGLPAFPANMEPRTAGIHLQTTTQQQLYAFCRATSWREIPASNTSIRI